MIMIMVAAIALSAVALIVGGIELAAAGGSLYYVLAGAALLTSMLALLYRRSYALPLFSLLLVATLIWSLREVGFDGWALVPRLVAPAVLGLVLLMPVVRQRAGPVSAWWIAVPVSGVAVVLGICAFWPHNVTGTLSPAVVLNLPDPLLASGATGATRSQAIASLR